MPKLFLTLDAIETLQRARFLKTGRKAAVAGQLRWRDVEPRAALEAKLCDTTLRVLDRAQHAVTLGHWVSQADKGAASE